LLNECQPEIWLSRTIDSEEVALSLYTDFLLMAPLCLEFVILPLPLIKMWVEGALLFSTVYGFDKVERTGGIGSWM
jgi:hypothetical protein